MPKCLSSFSLNKDALQKNDRHWDGTTGDIPLKGLSL